MNSQRTTSVFVRGRGSAHSRKRLAGLLAGVSSAALLTTALTSAGLAPAQAAPEASADAAPSSAATTGSVTFRGNDGEAHDVSYDGHSFSVDGERLHIWSGEFHYWRLPSPEQWRDILQKLRANGFNAVSLYFFWGIHQNEAGGDFDFSGIKDIDRLLTMAEEEGLYVIVRPGPYVNAEISMGGLPAYLTDTANDGGNPGLRTMANAEASKDWLHAFDQIAKKHQLTDGGGSIILYQVENEMLDQNAARVKFMKALVDQVKADGITVPLFHNDWGMGGRFNPTEGGEIGDLGLDFYAYDNYPLGFTCSAGRQQLSDFEASLRRITTEGPNFITEAQGGAFSPWGANFGFDTCYNFTDPDFIRQYGVNNIANGVTAFNYYMAFGGTNWGWTGSPSSGYTSYDYGAAIDEDRNLTDKFTAQRELGYYQNAVPQIASMSPLSAPAVNDRDGDSVNAYQRLATENLGDSATGNGTRFLGYRLTNSNSTTTTKFTTELNLNETEAGSVLPTTTVNDTDPRVEYSGDWDHDSAKNWTSGSINQDESYGKAEGASATLEFEGTGITLISSKSNNHGKAAIYIDGEKAGESNTCIASNSYESEYQAEAFSVSDLDPRVRHTIKVESLGEVGCPDDNVEPGVNISIDAFKITPAPYTVDDTQDDKITYSGDWETNPEGIEWAQGDYLDTETYSETAGDYVEYTFTGTGIQVISPQSINHGYGTVTIDGEEVGQTNTYSQKQNASKQVVAFEKRDLAEGEHTIRITVVGDHAEGSSGNNVSIDAFNVLTADDDEGATGEAPVFERIPQQADTYLTLHGRDALALTADYKAGDHDLYYTTSEIVGNVPTTDGRLLTLDGYSGDAGETVLHYAAEPSVEVLSGDADSTWDGEDGTLRLNYTHQPALVKVTPADGDPLLVRITNRDEMGQMWLVDGARGDGNETTEVFGAHLVRTVTYDGDTAELTGSMTEAGTLDVFVPAGITKVTWNGQELSNVRPGEGGAITGDVPGPEAVATPQLKNWQHAGENPEAAADFDDSGWVVADATEALNPQQGPGPNVGVVLDSNYYHFFEGDVWYRAHYTATDANTIVLNGNGSTGGPGHGKNSASMLVWVNGQYAGSAMAEGANKTFTIPEGATTEGEDAVVSVLIRNQGQNLDWSDNGLSKQNRGLWDAKLNNDGAVTWKIQGARDVDQPIDQARTLYNNGGLYGERAGWYLPGYPDEAWDTVTDMHAEDAGVDWYRTSFDLDVPDGQDARFALKVDSEDFASLSDKSRTVMFVNGWNVGTWVGYIGPQSQFTIPSGFLNMNGENEVAIAVTAEEKGAGPDSVELVQVGNVTGGMPNVQNEAPELGSYALDAALATESIDEGAEASLSGSFALPDLAGGALANVTVDWGDDSKPEPVEAAADAKALSAAPAATADGGFVGSHTYREAGTYQVTVQATEQVGGAVLAEKVLTVTVGDDSAGDNASGEDNASGDENGSDQSASGGDGASGDQSASGDESGTAGSGDSAANDGAKDQGSSTSQGSSASTGGESAASGSTGAGDSGESNADHSGSEANDSAQGGTASAQGTDTDGASAGADDGSRASADHSSGELSVTGTTVGLGVAGLALALLVTGGVLLARRRRMQS